MTFKDSIQTCLRKYASFSGHASRSEFWWFYSGTKFLIYFLASFFVWASVIVYIATLIPAHAAAVRRLRDQGRWVWQILILSPLLLTANFFFLGALDGELYASEPEIFLVVTIIYALPTFRAFWILTGPSTETAPSGQNNEVTP